MKFFTCSVCFHVPDLSNNNQDAKQHAAKEHTLVPPGHCIEFHPPVLHFNSVERNHAAWSHSHMPCFHYRTRTFPHTPDSCVNLAARSNCTDNHCCECLHRKLDKQAGCFYCLSLTSKPLLGVTQLHVSPWCSGVNCAGGYQGICVPKHGQFYPKSLPTPLKRLDFQAREIPQKGCEDTSTLHTGKEHSKFGPRLETDLKPPRKEETLIHNTTAREDDTETIEEVPLKKMKIATTSEDHGTEKKDRGEASLSQNTTQLNIVNVKETNVSETVEEPPAPQAKIKKEFSEPQTADNTNNGELCNGEKTETKTMDNQENVPHKTKKKPQHAKSKKGIKDGIIKPYNTRVATSRPRTYSSDFVIPEEEDWKDKAYPHLKVRQRSKLNRLLANEHERRRVAQLNNAYQDLRQLIPGYQCDTKLPKIKILKYAINYIAHLDDILGSV